MKKQLRRNHCRAKEVFLMTLNDLGEVSLQMRGERPTDQKNGAGGESK